MGTRQLSERGIIGRFYNKLEQSDQQWVGNISHYFPSDQFSEDYRFLGMSPGMREWIGGRQAKGLRDEAFTIKNVLYESTLKIDADDMKFDKTGQILVRIDEQVGKANKHWLQLITDLIIAGEAGVCYDGQYFFDTDHASGASGNQSNDITTDISALGVQVHGTTTAPSPEEMQQAILKSVQQMYGFKDDTGDPMNEEARQFVIMVPVSYWHIAAAALGVQVFAQGSTNVIGTLDGFKFDLRVNPRLPWTDKFATFRADGYSKPFIRQEQDGLKATVIGSGSELEFNTKEHHYGLESRRGVGYGQWQCAVLNQLV